MAIIREDNGDAGQTAETQYAITLGDVFQGKLESGLDTDWIRIEPSAGKILDISIVTDEFSVEMQLLDSEGNHIAYGSLLADETLIISPAAGDIYYIDIYSTDADYTGEYEVSIVENTIPIGTYEEMAAYMTDGYWEWRIEGGSGAAFDVSSGGILTANITALNENDQQFARWALENWSNVTGITFQFVNGDNADITFEYYEGNTARAGYSSSNGVITAGNVYIPEDDFPMGATTVDVGDIFAFLHEIGHAIGLGHPGPYPKDNDNPLSLYSIDNIFLIDSFQTTVMTYFSQRNNTYINANFAIPTTPMIADIIAVQNLYGIPTDTHVGDTVYGYESNLDGYLGHFFAAWTGEQNPLASITSGPYSAPEFGDLDGDNDLDLLVGNQNGRIDYYENTGTVTNPIFTQRADILNPLEGIKVFFASSPALADLDGDGDIDLILGNSRGSIDYYENDGTVNQPDFVQRSGMNNPLDDIDVNSFSAPALADLDADGDLDLVVGSQGGGIHYFENIGTANSPNYTQRRHDANPLGGIEGGFFSTPTLTDLDGDNDLDLIVGYLSGSIEYHENTGTVTSPSFALRSDTTNLLQGVASWAHSNPVLTDLDGDGDHDLIFGNDMPTMQYYENIGSVLNPLFAGRSVAVPTALTLYDNGGNDTLDLRTDTTNQVIDLSPEGISDVFGLVGNLVIARDTIIENYVAGNGNDIITGNDDDNVIEGRAGADTIDGVGGADTAAYTGSDSAVTVNLSDGTATGGDAEGDTLTSIENLSGSAHDDTLTGDASDNVLEGAGGADTLDGGDGADTASWAASDAAITIDLSTGTNTGGHAAGDTITNIESLLGSRYSDVLTGDAGANRLDGGAGNDRLTGGAGADTLVGGTGLDTASYAASATAVTVNLETGAASGGDAQGDSLESIEYLTGSAHDDTLIGDADNNVLEGGAGADTLDGGDGIDTASYAGSASRVDVRLSGTVVNHGDATGDTLTNIENLIGSAHNDILAGDRQANTLAGLDGNDLLWASSGDDLLTGGPGADRLVGGAGLDTASWAGSSEAVTVRLHSLAAKGGDAEGDTFPYLLDVTYTDADGVEQTETLPDVENLTGSAHDDILAGDRRDNDIDGGAGNDTLYGGPGGGDDVMNGGLGNDRLFGGQGNDTLDGGPGDDSLAGGPGNDVFVFGPSDGADTVTDFSSGTDKVDLTAFEIESIDDVDMTTGDDGVTVELSGIDGGSILLADLTTLPEAGDFVV